MHVEVQNWGSGFDRLADRIREMFKEMRSQNFFCSHAGPCWKPRLNLYEMPAAYVICVDLAGMTPEEIGLSVEGRVLRIEGHRRRPLFPQQLQAAGLLEDVSVHVMEIDSGAFRRDVLLEEDTRTAEIAASYRKGLLWIVLPRVGREGQP